MTNKEDCSIFGDSIEIPKKTCTAYIRKCGCGETFSDIDDDITVCPNCDLPRKQCSRPIAAPNSKKCIYHKPKNSLRKKEMSTQLDLYVKNFRHSIEVLEKSNYRVNRDLFRELALGNTIELVNDIISNPDISSNEKLNAIEKAVNIDIKTSSQVKQISVNHAYYIVVGILNVVKEVLMVQGYSKVYQEIFTRCNEEIHLPEFNMDTIEIKPGK